ncbi:uncharacterized protein LY79DRAFT_94305 [Colletotrichum navitas]|uniref:Uncharacterized protein n=1 Tax=Colletotrichum navitas TaxID=681940 RepID=A0AAD8Q667_9PEZI|nr:uncharacterized protein LY79DRAFT_94305 [Colletotrichum navitas]KAK1595842.1 hypothetical protein LY79DRAFT_94305 [Colletotrichum navitas]
MYFTNEGILTIYPPIDPPLVPPVYIDEKLLIASNQPTAVTGLSKEYQASSVDFPSADYREPLTQPRHRLHSHPEHLQVRQRNNLPQFSPPPQVVLFNDFQFPGYEQMNLHNTASLLVRDILMTAETRLRVKAAQQQVRPMEQSGSDTGVRSGFLAAPQHYRLQQHGCEDLQPHVAGMSNMALLGEQPREPIQLEQMGRHCRSQSGQRMQPQSRLHCELKSPFQQHDKSAEDNSSHGIYNAAERQD